MTRRCAITRVRALVALMCACAMLAGCKGTGPRMIERGVAPSFADAAARYNAVVQHYDRLWSPVALRIRSTDPESGKRKEDLLDGHLQAIPPALVALRIDKLSETYAYLGSDAERYWWVDVKGSSAMVGRHDEATPQSLARLDIPVHPLDLVDLLGIVPVNADAPGATRWSDDGRTLGLLTRGRFGNKAVWVDPETYEPRRVDLTDGEGRITLTSVISRPERLPIDGEPGSRVRIATQYDVSFAGTDTSIGIRLQGPENRRNRMRPAAFDMETVLRTYGIKEVLDADLHERTGAGAARTP